MLSVWYCYQCDWSLSNNYTCRVCLKLYILCVLFFRGLGWCGFSRVASDTDAQPRCSCLRWYYTGQLLRSAALYSISCCTAHRTLSHTLRYVIILLFQLLLANYRHRRGSVFVFVCLSVCRITRKSCQQILTKCSEGWNVCMWPAAN